MSGVELFGRAWRITISTVQIEASRCSFTIARSLRPEPNTAEVRVWNLAPNTRQALELLDGVPVKIEAGYEAAPLSTLYLGELRRARTHREGVDLVTEIASGDGEQKLRTARVKVSVAKNATTQDVLRKLVQALGVAPGNSAQAIQRLRLAGIGDLFSGGTVLYGSASREMSNVCRSCGLEWSVQDGALQLLPRAQALEGSAILLTARTGLVGSPTVDGKGRLSARSLLVPDMMPGRKVVVEAEHIKGAWRVDVANVTADTHGQDWYHDIEGTPL